MRHGLGSFRDERTAFPSATPPQDVSGLDKAAEEYHAGLTKRKRARPGKQCAAGCHTSEPRAQAVRPRAAWPRFGLLPIDPSLVPSPRYAEAATVEPQAGLKNREETRLP